MVSEEFGVTIEGVPLSSYLKKTESKEIQDLCKIEKHRHSLYKPSVSKPRGRKLRRGRVIKLSEEEYYMDKHRDLVENAGSLTEVVGRLLLTKDSLTPSGVASLVREIKKEIVNVSSVSSLFGMFYRSVPGGWIIRSVCGRGSKGFEYRWVGNSFGIGLYEYKDLLEGYKTYCGVLRRARNSEDTAPSTGGGTKDLVKEVSRSLGDDVTLRQLITYMRDLGMEVEIKIIPGKG